MLPTILLTAYPLDRRTAQDPWEALQRASSAYRSIRTLAADFEQIVISPLVGEPDTTRGRMFLVRPNRFAMRFSEPAGDRIVADGRYLWLYTPSTAPEQVIRTAIPAEGPTGPNLIGQFVERPRERYEARWVRVDSLPSGPADVIALEPRVTPAWPYRRATIWVDRVDGLLRRIEIDEAAGQQRVVILLNVVVNEGVPSREITFSPPAGARVVSP